MDPKKGKDVPDDAAAESTFSEYLRRCRDGESLSFEDFCAEHAEIEDALRILHARHVGEDTVAHDVDPSKLPIADELLEGERRLGDYRIIREIGRGGMGTVFEAIQESLGRRVALKILPGNFALDPKRVERFHREARSTAKIHHANIVPVYDVGEADGNHFYSMEFIDGPSLHQVISEARASAGKTEGSKKDSSTSDPAYISNAVERMAELAEGLEEAHKLGLIHRDVKLSNILVDKSGRWVLVDFGLVHEEAAQTITRSGEMIGTLSYMSPEQVSRRKVDVRSDVYSLGLTLYETLTLRAPFEGESDHQIQNAILFEDPAPPRKLNRQLNRDLETIILRALEKNPERRYPSADELARDLRRFLRYQPIHARPQSAWRRVARRAWRYKGTVAAVLIIALVLLASALTWKLWSERRLVLVGPRRLTSDPGLTTHPTLSADGQFLAYASDRGGRNNLDVWFQRLPDGEPRRLTSHEADDHMPALSSDGTSIVFRSERDGGGVHVLSTDGKGERWLARHGMRPRFSPDGEWVAYWVGLRTDDSTVHVVPSTGGEPRQLQPHFMEAYSPVWSPSGDALLFVGRGTTEPTASSERASRDWWITPVTGGVATKTGAENVFRRHGIWLPGPGKWIADRNLVLFASSTGDSNNLWAVPLAPETGRITAEPQLLATTAQAVHPWGVSGGRVLFTDLDSNDDLWTLPIDAERGTDVGTMQQLTDSLADDTNPSISSDGGKLVFISNRSGNADVWLKDPINSPPRRLTKTPLAEYSPQMTVDGSRVAYGSNGIWVQSIDGNGDPERVCEDCFRPEDWSSTGTELLYLPWDSSNSVNVLSLHTRLKTEVLRHPEYTLWQARFSPDDEWIAFKATVSPLHRQIFVARYHPGRVIEPADWVSVTDSSTWADKPRWSPKGNRLYYTLDHQGFRCIYTRRFEQGKLGDPVDVHHLHSARLSVLGPHYSMDVSRKEIVVQLAERTGNIWTAELKEEY